MNIVFAGTPRFSVPSLQALLDAGHHVSAVYTQPDRPTGRGQRVAMSPVKELALANHLPVLQPVSLRDGAEALRAFAPNVMIVVAYGLLLPAAVLEIPAHGCINVHASLLPRWRGAAPIQRAIEAGDAVTGVTIMQMESGLDTGPMLAKVETAISETDTAASLHDRLASLGATALVDALADIEAGQATPEKQDEGQATYARKLTKEEAHIDWRQSASVLARKVRAFNPWPVAYTTLNGATLRVWEAREDANALLGEPGADPGTILTTQNEGIAVATGAGALTILRLQMEGGKPLSAQAFLNGRRLRPGDRLE